MNETIGTNAPTLSGAPPTSYTIAPALPDGLMIDGTTGEITGTPTAAVPLTGYTVTANYGGT